MALTKLEPNWWIELENTYRYRVKQRKQLDAKYGKAVLGHLPVYLPSISSLSEDKRYFRNKILGTSEDLGFGKPPLEILMDNVPEDFAIMMRDEKTGFYFFPCRSDMLVYRDGISVRNWASSCTKSMNRFFSKMPTDGSIQRGSWGLEISTPLFIAPADPREKERLTQNPSLKLSDCYLRVDWQTLRRLPLSGAIVFNFKALFTPITEFRDEPGVPALIAKVLREGKRSIHEY
ncbi:hypothetical protein VTO42DRAFT_4012 [Malbranchea cinnamomea]